MTPIGHRMILASAGSGKTYALTNRFVRLLALGARPERIVALTFTRKAAGEFFDEILNKLARAAGDAAYARSLAAEIEMPQLGAADFLRLLRAVVDAMHRLRLGTFDGFFARIARNFPFELGLAGEFEVLQDYPARQERARVLHQIFSRSGELDEAQREFIEAFRRATFGADEKRLGVQLDRFIDAHQEAFLATPDADYWGNPARIWPEGSPWAGRKARIAEHLAALRGELARMALGPGQQRRWDDFMAALPEWRPGAPLPKPVEYLLGNALKVWADLNGGRAELTIDRKKLDLGPEACAALVGVVAGLIDAELSRKLEITRGIHAVLRGYERVYHDAVRREGKLTFADVQRLLMPTADGAPALTQVPGDAARLFIDFRLDAEIEHWLLDEFQDTSFGQWQVIQNLVDEAVQDPTGARSLFYVGDVKQAIFAWREGDPRLFREIFNRYNAARLGVITEDHLVKSYRSGPAVIAMVNAVFGDAPSIRELFPAPASETWNEEWRDHESAKPQLGGQAALLHASDPEERFATALRLLHEIEPLERGLSCALLVQKNETAADLADYLRREGGLPAVAESNLHVCTDNPVGAALLALVKAAAFPDDSLAQEQLRMTPLGEILRAGGAGDAEALTRRLLRQVHGEGFERALAHWARRLEATFDANDRFSPLRLRQFLSAAALFDETGSRNAAEFIEFMQRHVVRDSDSAAVIRVMTIHKAKGLGFDLVILPDLEGVKLDSRRGGLGVQRNADRSVEWVMELPTRTFYSQDAVLAAHVAAAESDACYESLSLLYVAMTRAKRAMYLITKAPGKSESRNFPRLLANALGDDETEVPVGSLRLAGSYTEGDPGWYRTLAPREENAALVDELRPIEVGGRPKPQRLVSVRPSATKDGSVPAASLFSLETNRAAGFGTEVHALFEQVEWLENADLAAMAKEWSGTEAGKQVLACLKAPALKAVWSRPAGAKAEVWRERSFESVQDGEWVTGVIDRVVVTLDAAGRPTRAEVYDFKTDWVENERDVAASVARHASQLERYRQVVARLTGLDPARVRCELVLTRLQVRAEVKPGAK